MKYKDLSNKVVGNLTILSLSDDKFDNNGTTRMWKCRCNCGSIVYKSARHLNEALKLNKKLSCGCSAYRNYVGRKFGDYEVKKLLYSKNGTRHWLCQCVCGDLEVKSTKYLLKSRYVCLKQKKERTAYRSKIKNVFQRMKDRCYNSKSKHFKYYGARGITICKEWLADTNSFVDWAINNGYNENLTIDRIDNDGNYCPENCRWVDFYVQANNKRNNKNILYNGEVKSLRRWCRELGLPYRKTHKRLFMYNWSVDKSFDKQERVGFI